ncbi:MAG: nuclear transport factor 2 family protein, partial [Sterolibacteriaceae bacterium]|nr:nuclear transport factor 2 family protein [Sterolibacteriaceae bacterium]
MDIDGFMESYKRAWETSDEDLLASLFAAEGTYRNTPFAVQQGHEAIRQYWQRTKLQTDIRLTYEVLQRHGA